MKNFFVGLFFVPIVCFADITIIPIGGGGGGSVTNLPATSNLLKGNGSGGASDTGIAQGSIVTNGATGLTLSGTVSGNGAGLTNLSGSTGWQAYYPYSNSTPRIPYSSINLGITNAILAQGIPWLWMDSTNANLAIGQGVWPFNYANQVGRFPVNGLIDYNKKPTGLYNIAIGCFAGQDLAAVNGGSGNIAIGQEAMWQVGQGNENTVIGNEATMASVPGVSNNTVYGAEAAYVTGSGNTSIGAYSMYNGGGSSNTVVGYNSGYNYDTTENQNILIGNAGTEGENNTIHIGTAEIHTATFIAGVIQPVSIPTNTANISTLTNPLTLGTLFTTPVARTAYTVNFTLNDSAISGAPYFVYSNFTAGETWTNANTFVLAAGSMQTVTFPICSPGDVVGIYDKSTGSGSVTLISNRGKKQ